MSEIKTPHFRSRGTDAVTLRAGRKAKSFRAINFTNDAGLLITEVCLVEMPSNKTDQENEFNLSKVINLMEDGYKYRTLMEAKVAPIIPKARVGDFIKVDGVPARVIKVNNP